MKKQLIMIIVTIILMVSCQDDQIDKNYSIETDKNFNSLLSYNPEINYSPSGKYVFIYSEDCTNFISEGSDNLSEDVTIYSKVLKKNSKKWWIIFDCIRKEVLYQGDDLLMIGVFDWDEKNNLFYFNLGTSPQRSVIFYKLDSISEPVKFSMYSNSNGNLYFISENKFISFYDINLINEETAMAKTRKIIISDLNAGNFNEILPDNKEAELKIIKWESESKLIYKEILDLNEIIKSYVIKKE